MIVILLCWLLAAGHAGGATSQAGFALIAGGAAGNLLDRLLHGGVTDFLELHAGRFFWPAFNLADSAITVGAVLVALELLRADASCKRCTHLAGKPMARCKSTSRRAGSSLRPKMLAGGSIFISLPACPN